MLKDTFCSSPWFHVRIDPAGNYLPCRWNFPGVPTEHNISNTTLVEYMNSVVMRELRIELLQGQQPAMCRSCYHEDRQHKVSGRQKQLLKTAIRIENFNKSFCASEQFDSFHQSYGQEGHTDLLPVDLQIDLGNVCNSACIMCSPIYSSRLSAEYDRLSGIDPSVFKIYPKQANWSDDGQLVEKLINELMIIPNIKYIHFLGGETLYLKSFYTICNRLIELGLSKDIIIGTTTNCTIYTPELENIARNFKKLHLGLSIEAMDITNDYIRWPSAIDDVVSNIKKFIALGKITNTYTSLRITPNIFSVYHLDKLFDFMLENSITAESCNVLRDPTYMRIELLPKDLLVKSIEKIDRIIEKYQLIPNPDVIINRRRDDLTNQIISDIIFEYRNLLVQSVEPDNVEQERYNLVKFIKAFESVRKNKILDYLPEYEEFLRIYGY